MKPATQCRLPAPGERAVGFARMTLPLLIIPVCVGCSAGHSIDPKRLAQIEVGVSSRADVEDLMGEPQHCAAPETSAGDTTLIYGHYIGWMLPGPILNSVLSLAGVSVPGISIVGHLWSGSSNQGECVAITCDRNGRVSGISTCEYEFAVGSGWLDRNQQSFSWTTHRILGEDARIYQGLIGADLSAMNEVAAVGDVILKLGTERTKAATPTDSAEPITGPAPRERTCSFEIIWKPGDTGFDAIETAFLEGTTIELAILDKSRETPGAAGPKGSFSIIGFKRGEAAERAKTVSVKVELVDFHEWVMSDGTMFGWAAPVSRGLAQ